MASERNSGKVYELTTPGNRKIKLRAMEILERSRTTPGGGPGRTALYRRLGSGERRLAVLMMKCDPYAQRLTEVENPTTVAHHLRNEFWSRGMQMPDIARALHLSISSTHDYFRPKPERPIPARLLRLACKVLGLPPERTWALMCIGAREHGWEV